MVADIGTTFISEFARHSFVAAVTAALWLTLPGWLVLRALGWGRRFGGVLGLLAAPALGLCTFGPASMLISTWRYTRRELIWTWIGFNLVAALAAVWRGTRGASATIDPDGRKTVRVGPAASICLLIGCALFGVMVAQCLFPGVQKGGLYVSDMLFDHAKIAISDSIAREGLPAKNPYYAPGGAQIVLAYYYLWHFVASQPRLLNGVSGWEADVAITWFTAFAVAGLLVALAVDLTGRAAAGVVVLLIASVAEIAEPLMPLIFPGHARWVVVPPNLMPLWLQCAWVPQHVMSATAVTLALVLIADVAARRRFDVVAVVCLGLFGAAAAGSSFWVGAVCVLLCSPLIVAALLVARLDRAAWVALGWTAAGAACLAALFMAPILYAQLVTPRQPHVPMELGIMPASFWIDVGDPFSPPLDALLKLGQVLLFWLQTLPLTVGVSVVLGLPALIARPGDRSTAPRTLRLLAGFVSVGYLLVGQFIKSTIVNNDLGWRTPIVPTTLLGLWAAAALVELPAAAAGWKPRSLVVRLRAVVVPLGWIGVALGLISAAIFYPIPRTMVEKASLLPVRQRFLVQYEAWHDVRHYAGKDDLVQANPDSYKAIGGWATQLPQAIFSDRATPYASFEYATYYAYTYDRDQNRHQYRLIWRIFQGNPRPRDLRVLRNELGVKVILVERTDGLWKSKALERSHLYRLAVRRKDYRVYVTREWHRGKSR